MASRVVWDDAAIGRLCASQPARDAVREKTEEVQGRAQSLGGGFRTGLYHRDHKSPAVGNTPAVYESNVRDYGSASVGIVYTGNYSAMKDNSRNNTLLKAIG